MWFGKKLVEKSEKTKKSATIELTECIHVWCVTRAVHAPCMVAESCHDCF
jgi:hypothetical protein